MQVQVKSSHTTQHVTIYTSGTYLEVMTQMLVLQASHPGGIKGTVLGPALLVAIAICCSVWYLHQFKTILSIHLVLQYKM